ncbi:MAG TPA: hypothetical protein VFK60_10725 [Casimicrobiaceae bacterium]|nr:hypothetical protein [Casimicrobiaceae bacterium]
MRITVTLDKDVAVLVTWLRRTRHQTLKQLINDGLRIGLTRSTEQPAKREAVRTRSVNLGRCLVGDIDNVAKVLAFAEDTEDLAAYELRKNEPSVSFESVVRGARKRRRK